MDGTHEHHPNKYPSTHTIPQSHRKTEDSHLVGVDYVGVVDGAHENCLHLGHSLLSPFPLNLFRQHIGVVVASDDLYVCMFVCVCV